MSEGYPDLSKLYHDYFTRHLATKKSRDIPAETRHIMQLLGRVIDLSSSRDFAVLGCGPQPETIVELANLGHRITGLEPIKSYVETANDYLQGKATVVEGVAESLPLADESQDVVFFESVLEHVDSPKRCLSEIYRVLRPGGILYLTTTNRLNFQISGKNGEYRTPYFNWFPKLVKESYVHHHLHYRPEHANFSSRPAVHWFSFTDLCQLGRESEFAIFYSMLDLHRPEDHPGSGFTAKIKRSIINLLNTSPWFRAAVLTQRGYAIVMLKRPID